jgi:two-component system, OmpR family, response regulator
MRILIAEDEERTAELLARGLRGHGHAVDVVNDGDSAITQAGADSYDLMVLDVMLPGVDGFTVCRRARQNGSQAAVLMLTARGSVEDRVFGFDVGADDYLVKPVSMAELSARVRVLARRSSQTHGPDLRIGDLVVNPLRYEAWRAGSRLELTGREFQLLAYFVRHAGEVLRRDQILDSVWDEDATPYGNIVDQYVYCLRSKLERYGPRLIDTVRGVGYILRDGAEACSEPSA